MNLISRYRRAAHLMRRQYMLETKKYLQAVSKKSNIESESTVDSYIESCDEFFYELDEDQIEEFMANDYENIVMGNDFILDDSNVLQKESDEISRVSTIEYFEAFRKFNGVLSTLMEETGGKPSVEDILFLEEQFAWYQDELATIYNDTMDKTNYWTL